MMGKHPGEVVMTIEVAWRPDRHDYLATLLDETTARRAARASDTPQSAVRDLMISNLAAIWEMGDVAERCPS